jgi:hypothetical protein
MLSSCLCAALHILPQRDMPILFQWSELLLQFIRKSLVLRSIAHKDADHGL